MKRTNIVIDESLVKTPLKATEIKTRRELVVFFIRKRRNAAMPISARDMTASERRYYEKKK